MVSDSPVVPEQINRRIRICLRHGCDFWQVLKVSFNRMGYSGVSCIRVAIFEATQMSCELMARALEASYSNIEIVSTGVSSDAENHPLNSASVAVISSTLREGQLSG